MILGAICLSLLFALYYPQPQRVTVYLWACLSGDIILFTVNHFWHDTSLVYGMAYASITALILGAVMSIVAEAIRTRQNSWKAAGIVGVLAVTLGRVAWLGMAPIEYYDVIAVIEGTVLFGCGLTIGGIAPYLERKDLAFTLAGMWLAQAFFRIGFYTHLVDERWLRANWVAPPLIGITGFLLIGLLSRHHLLRLAGRHRDSMAGQRLRGQP